MEQELDFLTRHPVDLYLDVGANTGQTGARLRQAGYGGRIVSFEPIAACFAQLAEKAAQDPQWEAHRTALGAEEGQARIGVSRNLVSSSLLEATEELIGIHEPIRYERHEEVPRARLDRILPRIAGPGETVHLKIDTQGYERFVIEGAAGVLDRIASVRMEVAVRQIYRGEMTFAEAIGMMRDRDYVLVGLWPAWAHPGTGEILQFDLLFRRPPARPDPA